MSKIVEIVSELAKPIVKEADCFLWDVEYVRQGGQWYLRIYIDREEGVSIDHCEQVSRALDPILDEADPIPDSYIFEVSSAGLERTLKKPEHFHRFMGEDVEVKLYSAVEGSKVHTGTLLSYEDGSVTIMENQKELRFEKKQIAGVNISLI